MTSLDLGVWFSGCDSTNKLQVIHFILGPHSSPAVGREGKQIVAIFGGSTRSRNPSCRIRSRRIVLCHIPIFKQLKFNDRWGWC